MGFCDLGFCDFLWEGGFCCCFLMFSQAKYLHPCFFPSEEISFQLEEFWKQGLLGLKKEHILRHKLEGQGEAGCAHLDQLCSVRLPGKAGQGRKLRSGRGCGSTTRLALSLRSLPRPRLTSSPSKASRTSPPFLRRWVEALAEGPRPARPGEWGGRENKALSPARPPVRTGKRRPRGLGWRGNRRRAPGSSVPGSPPKVHCTCEKSL